MPSIKIPTSVVLPGAGRLPAATISASAFIVPGGGGAGAMAALQAHINDPVDAHMAGAIGIPPFNPVTLEPLLNSNVPAGVIDGESVLDFITQFKDLIPAHPNYLGVAGALNSGVPVWGNLDNGRTGGYTDGGAVVYTHEIFAPVADFTLSGIVYPADRGVVALYSTTDADFSNPFSSATLVAALYLGTTLPAPSMTLPAGIPVAGFDEAFRTAGQGDYTASNMGLDLISLTYRLPYLSEYGMGVPYSPYSINFYSYQLATYTIAPQAVAAGGNQSWFLVHWRSTFATSAAAIDPTVLTLADLVSTKCFSAVPSAAGDFDDKTKPVYNIARHNVFTDTAAVTTPSLISTSSSITASTHKTSGLDFYDATTGVDFTYSVVFADLFNTAYLTGDAAPVPSTLYSDNPVRIIFNEFGDTKPYTYRLDELLNPMTMAYYSAVNPPTIADQGERSDTNFPLFSDPLFSAPYTAGNFFQPWSRLQARGFNVWADLSVADTTKKYLFDSWDQTGNAGTQGSYDMKVTEKFVDESYRYITTHTPAFTDSVKPAAMDAYDSTVSLGTDTDSLQVIASHIGYPQLDFSGYDPAGPDYSTLPGTDMAPARRYLRAFDTGVPRNTGKIRLRGLALTDFRVDAAYDGAETTGHLTGGAIIQLMVPGVTGWLDLGRDLGDPALNTADFYGCSTGILVDGLDIIVSFETNAFTLDNGAGEFPLFVRVSFLNNAAGRVLSLDELEWQAP